MTYARFGCVNNLKIKNRAIRSLFIDQSTVTYTSTNNLK